MPMKINRRDALNAVRVQSETVRAETRPTGSGYAGRSSPPTGDEIERNGQADLLSKAETARVSERASNVQRLQALLRSGEYQTDTAVLSRAIVSGTLNGY